MADGLTRFGMWITASIMLSFLQTMGREGGQGENLSASAQYPCSIHEFLLSASDYFTCIQLSRISLIASAVVVKKTRRVYARD